MSVTIEQTQPTSWPTYRLPLVIELSGARAERHQVDLTGRLVIDPNGHVLKVIE